MKATSSVDATGLVRGWGRFENIWEQNPGDSLDRTPLRVGNCMHVRVERRFQVRVAEYCLRRFHRLAHFAKQRRVDMPEGMPGETPQSARGSGRRASLSQALVRYAYRVGSRSVARCFSSEPIPRSAAISLARSHRVSLLLTVCAGPGLPLPLGPGGSSPPSFS